MASYRRDVAPMTGTLQTSDTGGDQDVTRVEPTGFTQVEPLNERGDDREEGLATAFRETAGANPVATARAEESPGEIVAEREDLPEDHRPYESEYAPRLEETPALSTMVTRQQPSSVAMVTHHTASAVPLDATYDPNADGAPSEPLTAEGGGIVDPRTVPLSNKEAAERREAQNEVVEDSTLSETTHVTDPRTDPDEIYDDNDQPSTAGNADTTNTADSPASARGTSADAPQSVTVTEENADASTPAGDAGEPDQGVSVDAGSDEESDDSQGSEDDQTSSEDLTSESETSETPESETSGDAMERPAKSDRKEEWVDYAQYLGVETTYEDEDGETKDKTKDDLIEDVEKAEAAQTED